MIRAGIGGWAFAPWRVSFYPEGLPQAKELSFASGQLTAIEINATFYRTQTPQTFAKWADETPDDFVNGRTRRPMTSCSRSRRRAM